MPVWTLGLNHHSAPLEVRERVTFAMEQMGCALRELRSGLHTQPEAAILSTCNRTEVYCASSHDATQHTLHWLAQSGGMPIDTLKQHTYTLYNDRAARHAFRVASGLDSMVLGEPEILGQMKRAVRAAQHEKSLGSVLNQLFQRSFSVAKRVRSTTTIGSLSTSLSAVATKLALQHVDDIQQARILFVGAGEMTQLTATHFTAHKPKQLTIANRHPERGAGLAARVSGNIMPLSALPNHLHDFDVVVSCTTSTLPLIGMGAVESALKRRKQCPMLFIDLAVPRDIEPEVQSLPHAHLYTVDDLATLVQTNQKERQTAVHQAEDIIDVNVTRFMQWIQQRDPKQGVVPLIKQVRNQAEIWRQQEVLRAKRQWQQHQDIHAALDDLSRRLNNKMLHGTMHSLHHASPAEQAHTARAARDFFLRDKNS